MSSTELNFNREARERLHGIDVLGDAAATWPAPTKGEKFAA